jgi:pilus assembly protein Flp/PilA
MKSMKKALVALWKDEEGLTMVEYAVAGGMIAAAGVLAFQALGVSVTGVITYLQGLLAQVPGGGGAGGG